MNELEKLWHEKIEYATRQLEKGMTKAELQRDQKFLAYLKKENELTAKRNAKL
ncbi:hypothetical protein [Enterococcus sp. JM9B]|uniref:hypothetical protein n=1 Tax=Enterococcus sp. JM9B TaxID=1857216 RepID=UPI001374B77D|nr:hypothetical protein [Enterococcus sp. JM9B]